MTPRRPTIVFVPGLRDHVPDHWQTLLAERYPGSVTVPRLGGRVLSRAAWVEVLDQTIGSVEGPALLVAHSAGVMMVAHWAQSHDRPIRGALLATPADLEQPLPAGYPTREQLNDAGWLPIPRTPLPFPSFVAASTNDPLARFERVAGFAADWGSTLVDIGAAGHLNPAAGYGEWVRAPDLIRQLGG